MEDIKDKTTIQVSIQVKEWLEAHGTKGETYDDVLRRCLKINGRKDS